MKSDTGESSASINRRRDDEAWPRAAEALARGATLYRPPKLDRFCVDPGDGALTGPTLSKAGVRRLEAAGKLRYVGPDRYASPRAAAAGAEAAGIFELALARIARGRADCGRPLGGETARQIARDALTALGRDWAKPGNLG